MRDLRALSFAALFLAPALALANVNTTPGSASVSADTAANATSPSFTTLASIVLTEGANTDFATGSGVTLKLDAPAGWQFNAGAGSVNATNGRDITASGPNQPAISVTSSQITVTFTVGGTSKADVLTISGIQVRPANGGTTTGGNILRNAGSTSTIAGVTGATNFGTLTMSVGAAKQLTMLTQPPGTIGAGATFVANPQVQVRDQFGTLRSGDNTTVITAARGNHGTATLQGTLTATAAAGVATFTNLSYNKAETMNVAFSGVPTGVTSNDVVVTAGAPTKLFFSVQPGNATAGSIFGQQPVVQTVDNFDNPSTTGLGANQPVTLILSSGSGAFHGSSTTTLDIGTAAGNGTVAFTDLRIDTSGAKQITAQSSGFADGVSGSFNVAADVATHYNVTAPATVTAGGTFSVNVTALDQFENTATGYAGTVHFTTTDGNATLPGDTTLTNGAGSFSTTLRTAANHTISATDTVTNTITGTTGTITVNPGATTHFSVSAPASTTAGASFSVTVTARDAVNNITPAYAGTVHFTSSDGAAVLPGNTTLTSGAGTFSATLKTAGSRTVVATDTVSAGITGTANVTVNPAAASTFTVTAPASSSAGASFSVTVTAKDPFNNTATGYSGTVHFASSDTQAVLPGDSTLTSGAGTFSVTLKTSGPRSVVATDTVDSSITGTANVTVNAIAATKLAFTTQPSGAVAGSTFTVVVKTQDTFGNNSTVGLNNNVTLNITLTNGVGPLQGTTSGNIGNNGGAGTLTLSTLRIDNAAAGKQLTAAATGFTSALSNSFTVSPGPTTNFVVSAAASSTAGNSFSVTVTAKDAFTNTTPAYAGTVHFTSNDAQAVLPGDSTLTSGAGTFSVTLKTSGSKSVVATDTVSASITGTTNVTVSAAAPATVNKTAGDNQTLPSGQSTTATIHVLDAFNNAVPSTSVVFAITGGNGTVNGSSNASVSTNGTGDASATWTFGPLAGAQTMTATAGTASATFNGTAICNYTTKQSGNWSSPSTWIGGCVPSVLNAVAISSGHAIVVDGDAFAASLTFPSATADTSLSINPGITLSVTGAIVFNTPNGVKVDETINVGSGTLNAGSITLSGAGAQQKSILNVSTGTINISGSISFPGNPPTQLLNATGAAHINIGGNFGGSGSLSLDPTSTINFNGSSPQTIGTYHPNNYFPIVTINNPTSVTMLGNLPIAGNLVINSGTFDTGNSTLQLGGNLINNATFTTSGTVQFIGTSAQTITGTTPSETFNNLVMNNAAGLTLAKPIRVNGTLTFTLGNITTGANTLTLNSAGTTSRTSGHVIGHYAKVYAAAASKTFETGTANGYSPVTLNATAGSFPATVTVTTTQAAHPNALTVDTLQRYWTIDPGSVSTANLTLNYLAGDVVGLETAYHVGSYNSGWSFPATGSVDAINHVGTATGVTSFGDFTLTERATNLVITSVNGGAHPIAGVPFNISVQTVDPSGHPTQVDLTTSIALSLTAGTSSLSGNLTGLIPAGSSSGTIAGVIYTKAETITVAVNSTAGMSLTQGTATFTVDPNVTTHLVLVPTPATQTAGVPVSVNVTAQDAYGNTTPAYTGTIAFGSSDGQAVLPANYTFTGGDAGVHAFNVTLKTAGVKSVVATDTVTGSITGNTNVTVTPAALDHFIVTTPGSTSAGNALNVDVTASDLYGNTVTSFAGTVSITSSDAAAVLPAGYTYTGADNGVHTFNTTLKTAGSQSVTATSGAITGSANVSVNPAAADHLSVTAPASATAGSAFNVTITAKDAFNNTATGYLGTVHFTSTDLNATLPADYTFIGGDLGAHTITGATTLRTAGSQTVAAADTLNASITGLANVTVNAGPLDHFLVESASGGNIAPQIAGAAFNIKITARDLFNNTLPSFNGTVQLTSNATMAGAPVTSAAFTAGVLASQPVTITTAQASTTISANDTVSGKNGTSNTFAVAAAGAANFLVEAAGGGNITPQIAGNPFSIRITVRDAFGNTVTNFSGVVGLTTNAGTIAPTSVTFNGTQNGVITTVVTVSAANNAATITATQGANNGTSNPFSVAANGPVNFLVEAGAGGNIGPQTAGAPFSIRVTARDLNGNPVTTFTGTVTLSTTAGTIAPPTVNFTPAGNGVVTVSVSVTQAGINQSITATLGGVNGTSNLFTVNAGPLDHFRVEAAAGGNIATQAAGTSFNIKITALDVSGNTAVSFNGTANVTSTGTLSAGSGATANFANGVLAAHAVTISNTGTFTITATNGAASGTSNSFSVTATVVACPTQVTAVLPAPEATVATSGFLRWTAINADTYSVYLGVAGTGCNTLVATTSEPQYFYQGLKGSTVYEWHIVANRAGCPGVPTQCIRFRTPVDCQFAAQLTLAAVVEVSSGATYHVSWNAVDATTYEIQESLDADFTNPTTFQTHDTFFTFQHSATQATRYFYRARAIVVCQGGVAWSSPVRVVVHPAGPPTDREFDVMTENGSGGTFSQDVKIAGAPTASSHGATTFASGNFFATSDAAWLKVSPTSGSIPPAGVTLTMTADTNGLPLGTSIAMVRIASTNGDTIDTFKVSAQSMKPTRAGGKNAPPKNSAIIPGVAHAPGVNSRWQSDVRIYNPTSTTATYDLLFTPSRSDGTISGSAATVEVAPKSTMALDDVVRHVFGYGAFGGEAATGALEIRPQVEVAPIITSRTYNVATNGTYGQFVPAFAMPQFVGPGTTLSLQQVAQSSKYRTNFGLVDASGAGGTVQVRVMNDNGQELNRFDITLAPFEQAQFDSYLQQRGLALDDGRIEVDVKSAAARIAAYASVIDNASNDPLLVPAVAPSQISANHYAIPGVANYNTPSASWRSDVRIYNASNASVAATLTFYPDNGSTPLMKNVTVSAGQTVAYDDVLPTAFGVSTAGGALHVTTPTLTSLIVTSRTYDAKTGATYGQFVPAVTPADGTALGGRALEILHVEESPVYRANVGVYELAGKSAVVEFTATLPDGRTSARSLSVNPYQFLQIGSLLKTLGFDVATNARVTIRVIGGEGRVAGYASVVDNRTQDPTYIPAQ